jgi:hypothetical protein
MSRLRAAPGALLRAAFRTVLKLPAPVLLLLCGERPLVLDGRRLDTRLQFHAWLVRRFRRQQVLSPETLRKPPLLGLGLL